MKLEAAWKFTISAKGSEKRKFQKYRIEKNDIFRIVGTFRNRNDVSKIKSYLLTPERSLSYMMCEDNTNGADELVRISSFVVSFDQRSWVKELEYDWL